MTVVEGCREAAKYFSRIHSAFYPAAKECSEGLTCGGLTLAPLKMSLFLVTRFLRNGPIKLDCPDMGFTMDKPEWNDLMELDVELLFHLYDAGNHMAIFLSSVLKEWNFKRIDLYGMIEDISFTHSENAARNIAEQKVNDYMKTHEEDRQFQTCLIDILADAIHDEQAEIGDFCVLYHDAVCRVVAYYNRLSREEKEQDIIYQTFRELSNLVEQILPEIEHVTVNGKKAIRWWFYQYGEYGQGYYMLSPASIGAAFYLGKLSDYLLRNSIVPG